jgi:Spy/CpxP family protein refolding chaperone
MKQTWLKYLLVYSLSLNVGGITAFLYSWAQNQQPAILNQEAPPSALRELVTLLKFDPEQRQIFKKIFPAHRENMQVWQREKTRKRQELLTLFKNEDTSWSDFQAKLGELRDIQFKSDEASMSFFLQLRQYLRPEQKIISNNFIECRLLKGSGGKGEWCRAQGMRNPGGRDRWRSPAATPQLPSE